VIEKGGRAVWTERDGVAGHIYHGVCTAACAAEEREPRLWKDFDRGDEVHVGRAVTLQGCLRIGGIEEKGEGDAWALYELYEIIYFME